MKSGSNIHNIPKLLLPQLELLYFMEEKKKPVVRRSDLIILLACVLVIGFVLVRQGGCYMVKRVEKLEWID